MKTLQHYIDKGHVRYMPTDIQAELKARVPLCHGDAAEAMFWVLHGMKDYPSCKACDTKLSSFHWEPFLKVSLRENPDQKQGYRPYCGRSCAYKFGTKQEAYKKTSLEKYGVEHPMQSAEIVFKVKSTNIDRYGAANPMGWSGDKFKELISKKYGVDNVRSIPGVHSKIAETKKARTADLLPIKIKNIEEHFKVTCLTDVSALDINRINHADLMWKHECGREWESNITHRGIRSCPSCSNGTSKGETTLFEFVKSICPDAIQRTKTVISPKEIDIWIPSKNIGIEFDGTYWHSAKFENKTQCLKKIELMEARGARLITVQEHLWVLKNEQVKTRLSSILGVTARIGGRSTKVTEISPQQSKEFLTSNHLQGWSRATVHLGLWHKEQLVMVATFDKPRWAKKHDWELIRMAAVAGVTVQGGASKLIGEFRKQHTGTIISYADRCWSTGNVYKQLGFAFSHNTDPSYWWVHHGLGTYARYQTQKKKLPRLLGDLKKDFYLELSEEDNMRNAGFLQLFDRGNSVWVLT